MLDLFSNQCNDTNTPLYMQVYQKVKNDIFSGALKTGSKLPSIRNLSEDLKISKHTVETAYAQLIADGIIKSVDRSGLYVEEISDWFKAPKVIGVHPDAIEFGAGTAAAATATTTAAVVAAPIKFNFDSATVDCNLFPYSQYKKVIGQCIDEFFSELMLCGDPQGDWGLRQEISKYVFSLRGVSCSPEQIVITAGTQHSVTLLCQILSNIHKSIAFEEPSELHMKTIFDDFNFEIVPIPVETDGINVRRIKLFDVKTVFVTPSNQFPYGMIMSLEKRISLLKWANENDGLIIEDDYECEFKSTRNAIKSLHGLDNAGRVVYLGSFSKVLMPSIRVGYMVLPEMLLEIYRKKYNRYKQAVPRIIQKSTEIFIKEGYMEKHLRKSRTLYREKRKVLIDSVNRYFGDRVTIQGTDTSLHLLLKVKTEMTEDELVCKAQHAGILVKPTSIHWRNSHASKFPEILVGFAGISIEDIPEGIRCLKICWFGA